MSHESYRPGKDSRDIRRGQAQHAQENDDGTMKEVRLGFAKSYMETAKPGDTLRRMIKRAYKDGKLYSERQANEAADRVIGLFGTAPKVKPGDRITFRNDSIVLSVFDRQKGGFVDTRIKLASNEASLTRRREAVKSSTDQTLRLMGDGEAEAVASTASGTSTADEPKASPKSSPEQLLAQQRREVIRAFIKNTGDLKYLINNNKDPQAVATLVSSKITSSDSRIPSQFQAYEFSQIISSINNVIDGTHYLIGLNPQTGEVVFFKANDRSRVVRVKVNGSSDLPMLRAALRAIANPS